MKLPSLCPSCEQWMNVHTMTCPECHTQVTGNYPLPQILKLNNEEQDFLVQFFLSSGSIKDMAKMYSISYPTMRNKIDDLIQKINNQLENSTS